MACRVGITTDSRRRRQEWERKYPNLKNWRIIDSGLSYSAAQKKEDEYARRNHCQAHHGGIDNERRNWSVYRFDEN